ncbi:DUF29 domain-containing protein [Thiospirillum jenense]|uniref:DUF29 domain-containing protein n=1 Tax=Thiospirillum jenense TaxID=1653858 RepID=A0A839HID4_9GAMM|nr:DUF29 domain-containing protein [Thiospirillum jenense]MBB1126688.1 DUF29 domain-containing protein [Thiospirillum jenense]
MTQYNVDFAQWAYEQAALCRQRNWVAFDAEHVADELENMGVRERRELISRLSVLLAYLLKWQYQPQWRGKSWRLAIHIQRLDIENLLNHNPSLRGRVVDCLLDSYYRAVLQAALETGLNEAVFPIECPFTLEQILEEYWPVDGE